MKKLSAYMILAALVLASCTNQMLPGKAQGRLVLDAMAMARTIGPEQVASFNPSYYVVKGNGPEGALFTSGELEKPGYEKLLAVGRWTITIEGYNEAEKLVAQDQHSVDISADKTTAISAILKRIQGTGSLELKVEWFSANEYTKVSGELATVRIDSSVPMDVTSKDAYSVTFKPIFLAAGDYLLNLKLEGAKNEYITETVQIYADCVSKANLGRTSSSTASQTVAYDAADPILPIKFFGLPSRSITINSLPAGSRVYLLKANKGVSPVSATKTGKAFMNLEPAPSAAMPQASQYSADLGFARRDHALAAAFNAKPLPKAAREEPLSRGTLVPYGSGGQLLGTTKSFWVEKPGTQSTEWVQITATLRARGEYSYIWVADENYAAVSSSTTDNKITSAQAEALRDKFDGQYATSYKNGIFKNVSGIFGYEFGGGIGGNGGRDEDQHISILVYDIDYDSSQVASSGGVVGFFWGKDYYSQSLLDQQLGVGKYKTNYSEIFYIDAYFTDKVPGTVYSTLAHEYQHMIHFNRKNITQNLSSPVWFNEMCSMNAEDLVLKNIGLDPVKDGAQDRLGEFCYHYAESGISDWLADSDVMKSYAGAFAFGAFLSRNYDGANFFKALMDKASTGQEAIEAVCVEPFSSVMDKYGQSLIFTANPSSAKVKTMNNNVTINLGGIDYTADAIVLSAIDQYDLKTRQKTGQQGLRTYLPTEQIELRPYGYSAHTSAAWANQSSLTINLNAPQDSNVAYFLMIK